MVDEASDASHKEQFNLSVRWVDNSYVVHEDPLGLVCLPDTTAAIILSVVKRHFDSLHSSHGNV